jgi:hypothetical protein
MSRKLACFRWYPSSKSGSQFGSQFSEDFAVAARYAQDSAVMRQKQRKTRAIVGVYRALALGRRGSSGGPTR